MILRVAEGFFRGVRGGLGIVSLSLGELLVEIGHELEVFFASVGQGGCVGSLEGFAFFVGLAHGSLLLFKGFLDIG